MRNLYVLVGQTAVAEPDVLAWSRWYRFAAVRAPLAEVMAQGLAE